MYNLAYVSICFILLFGSPLYANEQNTEEKTVLKIITAPEVKEMLDKKRVILINSLTSIEYIIQHIPGSISIPFYTIDNTDKLPDDKTSPLIFYCMGKRCLYSKKASLKAIQMGYKNVYWFEGGIPDWYRFNYPMTVDKKLKSIKVTKLSPKKVIELMKRQPTTIIDVKPKWWKSSDGIIEGTLYFPLVELQETYTQIPRDKPVIITDALMRQSPSAARFLIHKGYQVLGVLKGGMTRWKKEGFPVIKE